MYLALRVESIGDAIKGLRTLGNARGFSVTIPHKVAAIPFLDEVEPTAGVDRGHQYDCGRAGQAQGLQHRCFWRVAGPEGGALLDGRRVLILVRAAQLGRSLSRSRPVPISPV
ncbi:MAG: hypothetical protein U0231_07905 [Nitrospiraceae bacterium]